MCYTQGKIFAAEILEICGKRNERGAADDAKRTEKSERGSTAAPAGCFDAGDKAKTPPQMGAAFVLRRGRGALADFARLRML